MNPRLGALAVAAALVVLAQFPFWLMQCRVMIQRPILNLDLLVAVVILLWSRWLGLAALTVAWLIEINHDASASYHFLGIADLVDAARFLDLVKLSSILSWQFVVALALLVGGAAAMAWLARIARPPALVVLAVVVLSVAAFGADVLNGSNNLFGNDRDHFAINANIAGSPGLSAVKAFIVERRGASEPMARSADPITFDRAIAWHVGHPDASVLLVLVESMGLPQSPAIRAWMASRLDTAEIRRRWTIRRTVEPFRGSTVYGELRVLCGLQGHYSRLRPEDEAQCLPRRFLTAGGQALGLHGFNMRMFDRQHWWRELGLEPQDLSVDAGTPASFDCNDAFPGVCDGAVLRRAAALAETPRRLVYVVTLDTHLPLPTRSLSMPPGLAELCVHERLPVDGCQIVNRLGWLLDQLQADLSAMLHPPLVLVSGDHAPPFLERAARDTFDPARVLGFVLEPR